MDAGKIGGFLLACVIGLGIFGWKMSQKSDFSGEYKELVKISMVGFCETPEETAYVEGLVDFYHDDAFDDAYKMGGRRSSASMDEMAYTESLFSLMKSHMDRDGQGALIERFEIFEKLMLSDLESAESE